jgi:lipooligosaccharide transport system permease protein
MVAVGAASLRTTPLWLLGARRAWHLVERNGMVYRRMWVLFLSGFFEPVFYLFSISIGISKLTGAVSSGGRVVGYTTFVAPALVAASAMNGAVMDGTFAFFFKLKFAKVYHAVLATPLDSRDIARGEVSWAVLRAGVYSAGFILIMAVMGLIQSPWAILCLPSALLEGVGFAAVAMAGTTYMRSWQDFDFVTLALMPMFLFSATFYPLSVYPAVLQEVVRALPLYQGVALLRGFDLGQVSWAMLGHAAYLAAMAAVGLRVAAQRLGGLILG